MKLHLPQTKGKPWSLRIVRSLRGAWGKCDYDKREIVLTRESQRSGVDREVFIHEMIHKICPWLDEEAVEFMAMEIDDALDIAGF